MAIPKFKFVTNSDVKTLKDDFYELKKWILLPCKFSPIFIKAKLTEDTEVAATYFDPAYLEDTVIEVAKTYFSFKDRDRKLILLHEIVHACHDKGQLFELHNELILYKYNELKDQAAKYQKVYGKDKTYLLMKKKLQITKRLVSLPFEMWNHLFIKENYPLLFPIMMNLVWTMAKYEYEKEMIQKFGKLKKFLILSHMIRLLYLKKMSKKYSAGTKFERLYSMCKNRLESSTDSSETKNLIQKAYELSDIEEYPDPSNIGKRYLNFVELLNKT